MTGTRSGGFSQRGGVSADRGTRGDEREPEGQIKINKVPGAGTGGTYVYLLHI
ncbi:hypothetical protein [Streptomyces rimosus]|uniref:hypothetical protein n=1 Tax=Streptomyces rimosus TaxID=1927 RepID=UPI0037CEBB36